MSDATATSLLTGPITLIFIALLGAMIGSFLNVVIYRLPRGMAVHAPRRSFCPACGEFIRPRDNLPMLGWLMLRGRCRNCRGDISLRYPVVEAITAVVFVAVWDQLFVTAAVPVATGAASDWPLAISFLTLFASLMACAAMDIESYMVDIRLCLLAAVVGIVAHTVRGIPEPFLLPSASAEAGRPAGLLPPAFALIGATMGTTWLVTHLLLLALHRRRNPLRDAPETGTRESREAHTNESTADDATGAIDDAGPAPSIPMGKSAQRIVVLLLAAVFLGLLAWVILAPKRPAGLPVAAGGLRHTAAAFILFIALVCCAWGKRPIDELVFHEIQSSRATARAAALKEMAALLPAFLAGLVLLFLLRRGNIAGRGWPAAIDWGGLDTGTARHGAAFLCALAGTTYAAALGWVVRIFGTLAFGKEAFGTGDIYILAAIGAVAGPWNCLFGFFMAAILALAGVAVTLLSRTHRAIPFGPWLALGSFCILAVEGTFLHIFDHAGMILWAILAGSPTWELGR